MTNGAVMTMPRNIRWCCRATVRRTQAPIACLQDIPTMAPSLQIGLAAQKNFKKGPLAI
jgi:hypothetical protein